MSAPLYTAFDTASALAKRCGGQYADDLEAAAIMVARRIHDGGIVYLMGNGGSAATCAHVAGELWGRFRKDRPAIRCIDLTAHPAAVTAIANDYGYSELFTRQLEPARNIDVVIGFTTSGKSPNVVEAFEQLMKDGKNCLTLAFCGEYLYRLDPVCDFIFAVPSNDTPRIQEQHDIMAHVLCESIERELYGGGK